MRKERFLKLGLMAIVAAGLTGCPAAGIYRTAKTLEPGVGDFNTNFSVTTITQKQTIPEFNESTMMFESKEKEISIPIPNVLGEYSYHLGLAENMEMGGRIALGAGLMELDFKYRFIGSDESKLHVAVNPAIGYRSAFLLDGTSVGLPLMVTYDVAPFLSVTAGGFFNMSFYDEVVSESGSDTPNLGGNSTSYGGALGLNFSGETFFLYPVFEFGIIEMTAKDNNDSSGNNDASFETQYTQIGLNIGVVYGREMKKLKKMDEKLDKMDGKLDKIIEKQ